jgi:hypothetical protein
MALQGRPESGVFLIATKLFSFLLTFIFLNNDISEKI